MAKIDAFFQMMHDQGASDLHLVSGQQPAIRIRGEIVRINTKRSLMKP
jgi:twitching motility protein PilT